MVTKKCVKLDIINKTYPIEISVIIPLFNEEDSLQILYEKLILVLDETGKGFEIIFVNDGSSDKSSSVLHEIQENDERVVVFESERNYGKANALSEGFQDGSSRDMILCLKHYHQKYSTLLLQYVQVYACTILTADLRLTKKTW
jgi:glycosyltransferase involved in cell wall biosynthesis